MSTCVIMYPCYNHLNVNIVVYLGGIWNEQNAFNIFNPVARVALPPQLHLGDWKNLLRKIWECRDFSCTWSGCLEQESAGILVRLVSWQVAYTFSGSVFRYFSHSCDEILTKTTQGVEGLFWPRAWGSTPIAVERAWQQGCEVLVHTQFYTRRWVRLLRLLHSISLWDLILWNDAIHIQRGPSYLR